MNKAKTFDKGKPLKAKDLNANAKTQTTKLTGGAGVKVSGHGQEKAIAITEAQRNPRLTRAKWAPYGGA